MNNIKIFIVDRLIDLANWLIRNAVRETFIHTGVIILEEKKPRKKRVSRKGKKK